MKITWNSLRGGGGGEIVLWARSLKENSKPTVMLHRFLDLHYYYILYAEYFYLYSWDKLCP